MIVGLFVSVAPKPLIGRLPENVMKMYMMTTGAVFIGLNIPDFSKVEAGMDDSIEKPIDSALLMCSLQKYIRVPKTTITD